MTVIVLPSPGDSQALLEIMQAWAKNVGYTVPTTVISSADRGIVEALQYVNEVGAEMARRVDWGGLLGIQPFTGNGLTATFTLPESFSRIPSGIAVTTGGTPLRALTRGEWDGLPSIIGTPRYFLLEGRTISFWPTPSNAVVVSVQYISTGWADGQTRFTTDESTTIYPGDLLAKGLIARWRRQKGMDYADWEAEFEAALADYAQFDDRSRA